jgi:hypothetical protein
VIRFGFVEGNCVVGDIITVKQMVIDVFHIVLVLLGCVDSGCPYRA